MIVHSKQRFLSIVDVPEPRRTSAPRRPAKTGLKRYAIAAVVAILCLISLSNFDPVAKANHARAPAPSAGSDVPGVPYFPAQYPPVTKPDSTEQPATF